MEKIDINKVSQYWLKTAKNDFKVMEDLFNKRHYTYSLFFGHLVIEKTLKAYYLIKNEKHAPLTHQLIVLAEKSFMPLQETDKEFLEIVTRFNIEARYPDQKMGFYKLCNKKFTEENLTKIRKLYKWLLREIKLLKKSKS